jgi:hypothetical protein
VGAGPVPDGGATVVAEIGGAVVGGVAVGLVDPQAAQTTTRLRSAATDAPLVLLEKPVPFVITAPLVRDSSVPIVRRRSGAFDERSVRECR